MNEQHTRIIEEEIVIRQIVPNDVKNLIDAGFLYRYVLDDAIGNRIRKMAGIVPRSKGLVAYDIKEKQALGFLTLIKHTSLVYSIKFLFTNPNFRKLGIATELLKHAESLSAKSGARCVYLNANSSDSSLVHFYTKRGYSPIISNSMIWGGGAPEKLSVERQSLLNPVSVGSKTNEECLFGAFKKIMGQDWINFFGVTANNVVNGFSQDYERLFFLKSAFVSDAADLLVFIYKIPFVRNSFVEFYVSSDSVIMPALGDLSKILRDKGIEYTKITAFNVSGAEFFDLLNRKDFQPFQARILGKML